MKIKTVFLLLWLSMGLLAQNTGNVLSLNGIVDFEQTKTAFPPARFTRTIPVPGLIDLATPKIDQYDLYFAGRQKPRYNWYRFYFEVTPQNRDKFAVLKVLKSFFNTQVIINGHDCGTYMQGSTPIDCDLTPFLKKTGKNELLLRLGERAWMPKEAATGFDREKYTDIPGIWDDVFIEFSGPVKVHRALALPDLKNEKVTAKIRLENYANIFERNMEYSEIEYSLRATLREKITKIPVGTAYVKKDKIGCQRTQYIEFEMDMPNPTAWSPDNPFLYEMVVEVTANRLFFNNYGNKESLRPPNNQTWRGMKDTEVITFGMRDFEPVGKSFYLNGEPINMFGSTLTLNRFFEDRDRAHLPWDKEWVEDLMIHIPKALGWNFFRVSIGILPEFWYDLADKHGILIQNEFLMWNLRGRPEGYLKEYTDWIWQDGNHPSIVIWDALNEQKEDFIGRVLIPELKELDHTRIWDLGYMKSEDVGQLSMTEIHWYPLAHGWWVNDEWVANHVPAFRFGEVTKDYAHLEDFYQSTTPNIVNEFGWLWQSRDGLKSSVRTHGKFVPEDITPYKKNYEYYEPDGSQLYTKSRDNYEYFLGKNASASERRAMQAYILGIEGEIIRSTREADGIASFAYLTNNNGYTGDWWKGDIKDLIPAPGLLVQYHFSQPLAVFVNVQDGRYLKNPAHFNPNQTYQIPLLAVNDSNEAKEGQLTVQLIDSDGKIVEKEKTTVKVDAHWQKHLIMTFKMPAKNGGYMILSQLRVKGVDNLPQVSRRYICVGEGSGFKFPEYEYSKPKNWIK